jgi:hypothetical protein
MRCVLMQRCARRYYHDHQQPEQAEDEEKAKAAAAPARQVLDPGELLRQAEAAANIDEVGGMAAAAAGLKGLLPCRRCPLSPVVTRR